MHVSRCTLLIYRVRANFGNVRIRGDLGIEVRNRQLLEANRRLRADAAGCVVEKKFPLDSGFVISVRPATVVSEVVVVSVTVPRRATRYTVSVHRAGQRTGMHMHRVPRLSAMEMQCNLMRDV